MTRHSTGVLSFNSDHPYNAVKVCTTSVGSFGNLVSTGTASHALGKGIHCFRGSSHSGILLLAE
jgi:hypothetical protein